MSTDGNMMNRVISFSVRILAADGNEGGLCDWGAGGGGGGSTKAAALIHSAVDALASRHSTSGRRNR